MMRRVLVLAGVLTLSLVSAFPVFAAPTLEREIRIDRTRVKLSVHEGLTQVDAEGAVRDHTPGRPDLPWLSERVELPEGWQIASIEVLGMDTEPLSEHVRVPSALGLRAGEGDGERSPEDPTAFSAPGFQPASPVLVGGQGYESGQGVAMLGVAPVRWDAVTGRLEMVTRVRVRLHLEPERFPQRASRERVVPWDGKSTARGAPVAGASLTASSGRTAQPFAATQLPSVMGSPVAYVIITNTAMSLEFQRLADWKTRSGLPAVVRTMDFIRANYPQGSDDAERVRLFIRDAYSRWGTKWVLLGGDTEVIPVRYAYTNFYGGENIPCDLYFSCLDGTWNADGDELYGEGYQNIAAPGDNVDLYPEVYVGRMPTVSAAQAKLVVDKTLQYVTDPDASGYQDRVLFFAEVLFPQNWLPGMSTTLDGAEMTEEVLPSLDLNPSVRFARLYENHLDARWRPGALQERRLWVIDSLNAGYNIAVHVGHGYRNVMSVGDDNLTNSDAMSLSNGRRLTNLYAINCTSNAIDFPSIGEAFLLAPNGGAVTNIGSTRFDFPTAGRAFQKEYFRLFFQDSIDAVGELQARQKLPFIASSTYDGVNRWTEMTLLLLGDPELRIYSSTPRSLAVVHAASMTVGDSLFTVNVAIGGTPLMSARVTANKPGSDFSTGFTDGAGNVTLTFRPDTVGTFQLTVTAYNSKPWQEDVPVAASLAAALVYGTPTVEDDGLNGTTGNGDGVPDAGETIAVSAVVSNLGDGSTGSVYATITTTDPLVTFGTTLGYYGSIPGHASAPPDAPFTITIPYSVPDQHEMPLRVNILDTGGRRSATEFQLTVRAPDLLHLSHVIVDDPGNLDGRPDPLETIAYSVRLRNLGTGGATAATAVLRSLDGLATVADSTTSFGTIAAGAEVTGDPFVFVPSSGAAMLQLRVSDASGLLFTRTLDLVTPDVPTDLYALGETKDIRLTWTAMLSPPDLAGYNIYRSTAQLGPYVRVNSLPTPLTSYFMDQNLTPLTRYFYRVTAVDSSANESAPSLDSSTSTSPPAHTVFPIPLDRTTPSPVAVDHVYSGYPLTIAAGAAQLYVFHPDGSAPVDADGAGTTLGDFTLRGRYYAGGPSIADLDGDGVKEFIGATWDSARVYVFDPAGNVRPGFPVVTGASFSGVAVGDLDGDGKKELVFATNSTPFYVLRWDGTDFYNGDSNPATTGVFATLTSGFNYGSPAIADLDGDGKREIVYGDAAGWLHAWRNNAAEMSGFPVNLHGGISSSAAIGYLDGAGDSQLEIVVAGSDDSLYVFKPDGGRRSGFPRHVPGSGVSKTPSPALADMDHDGFIDIVQAGTDGSIRVFDRNGGEVAPWVGGVAYTWVTAGASESSPVVADINGDGWEDVVIGGEDATVTVLSGADGTVFPGFPIALGAEIKGTPAVCDCDGDGMTEIILACWDMNLYMWDYDFAFSPGRSPSWPQFHHDAARTGLFTNPVFVSVDGGGDPGPVAPRELSFSAPQPNPARTGTRLGYGIPATDAGQRYELTVFDLGGRRIRTLDQGIARGGRFSADWDMRDENGARVGDGVFFVRFALGATSRTHKIVVLR